MFRAIPDNCPNVLPDAYQPCLQGHGLGLRFELVAEGTQ